MPDVQTADSGGAATQPAIVGGIDPGNSGSANLPDIQHLIATAVSEATEGLKKRVDEFRETNVTLKKEKAEWESLGMPLEKIRELVDAVNKSDEGRLIAAGRIDDVVASRIEPIRRDWESRVKALETSLAETEKINGEYKKSLFDLQIETRTSQAVASNNDIHAEAMPTIILLAKQVWRQRDDGTIAPFRTDGLPWKGSGGRDITFEEWLESLRDQPSTRFLFKSPSGLPGIYGDRGGVVVDTSKMSPEEKLAYSRQLRKTA